MSGPVTTPMRDHLTRVADCLDDGWRMHLQAKTELADSYFSPDVGKEVARVIREHLSGRVRTPHPSSD